MMPDRDRVAASIVQAQAELEQALADLEYLPTFEARDLAFAAHALNNYLTVAAGTIEFLGLALADHPDPQVATWLQVLRQATRLMEHTTSQLMSTSATESSPKLAFSKVDLVAGVQRACHYYQRIADRKQIRIVFEASADCLYARTDRVAAAAVLDNLLSNAVKYSHPGRQIWVRVRPDGDSAVCSVQDEGPGLSREDQARLFQRGVRLSPTPTAGEPSSGYGLAVAKELIGRLDGEIWCESEAGSGACFCFRLPGYRETPDDSATSHVPMTKRDCP